MVAVQYTMCCVQCVLGFGKSDRGGVAPVGGEVRTLVNRRHRCRRERERERETPLGLWSMRIVRVASSRQTASMVST